MILIKQAITMEGVGCDERTWARILKAAWLRVGQFWHQTMLPKHFSHAAAAEYNYAIRGGAYTVRKFKEHGHTYPLVYTGEMRRQVERIEDVRSDRKGARVYLHGPKYLWQYRKDLNQPDKAAELSAVSARDAMVLALEMDRAIVDEVQKLDRAGKRTIYDGHRGHAAAG